MKAIRVHSFGGPEVLELEDLPDPQCGSKQVVVRLESIGVNPVEAYVRAGTYPRLPTLPYTPGTDGAGVIQTVGDGLNGFEVGDRVYLSGSVAGTYATLAVCETSQIHPLQLKNTFSQGAAVGVPCATAYRALFRRALAVAGESVLIHGATGGVGTAAVQLARAAGLTVFGTGGTDAGLRLVLESGAHHALNHHKDGYLEELKSLTNGTGVNLVIEMLASTNLAKDLDVLAMNGRVVIVGSRGPVQIDPRASMGKDSVILGMSLNNASAEELRGIHAALGAALENGSLRPVIGKEFPLADASKAHRALMEPGTQGKVVLNPA